MYLLITAESVTRAPALLRVGGMSILLNQHFQHIQNLSFTFMSMSIEVKKMQFHDSFKHLYLSCTPEILLGKNYLKASKDNDDARCVIGLCLMLLLIKFIVYL